MYFLIFEVFCVLDFFGNFGIESCILGLSVEFRFDC